LCMVKHVSTVHALCMDCQEGNFRIFSTDSEIAQSL
jgi:hypothetical protein